MTQQDTRPRPEQTFFADASLDRAVGMIMTLAAELWVVTDRLRALERMLEQRGQLAPGALDRYVPTAEEAKAIDSERREFVEALMERVVAQQKSKGAL